MLEAFIKEMESLACGPKQKYLLGVSGGADSMALANLLHRADFDFVLVHVNYGLRGKESDDDAEFVRRWSQLHHVPLEERSVALDAKKNTQIQARLIRYDLFDELANKLKVDVILTAHHLDDQIETIYMNILRGSGFKGFRGIPQKRGNIIRPLLRFRKEELMEYLRSNGFHWREDSSNAKMDYTRNKVRHQALPKMRELVPDFDDRLIELSSCASELEMNMERFLPILYQRAVSEKGDLKFIELRAFEEWNQASDMLLLELLRYMGFIWTTPIPIKELSSGKEWHYENQKLYAHRSQLILETHRPDEQEYSIEIDENSIDTPIPLGLRLIPNEDWPLEIDSGIQVALDYDKLQFPLTLRRWKEGDRFMPLGMKKFKKLSDHFIDLKVPRPLKRRFWLLCSGEDIVWIVGGRMDARFRVVDATENIYLVSLLQKKNSPLEK